jgi:hypothetical protein
MNGIHQAALEVAGADAVVLLCAVLATRRDRPTKAKMTIRRSQAWHS